MNWNQELQKWLEERNLTLQVNVAVLSPVGDAAVSPQNFIPQGWQLRSRVEVVFNGKAPVQDTRGSLPDIPLDAGEDS